MQIYLQLLLVTTLIFGWWEEGTIQNLMVEWRCASRDSGGACVMMTPGIPEMQWLSADSLVLRHSVRNSLNVTVIVRNMCW